MTQGERKVPVCGHPSLCWPSVTCCYLVSVVLCCSNSRLKFSVMSSKSTNTFTNRQCSGNNWSFVNRIRILRVYNATPTFRTGWEIQQRSDAQRHIGLVMQCEPGRIVRTVYEMVKLCVLATSFDSINHSVWRSLRFLIQIDGTADEVAVLLHHRSNALLFRILLTVVLQMQYNFRADQHTLHFIEWIISAPHLVF